MTYYAIINDCQIGPMELPELVEAGLMPETYVWCKGMSDWKHASEVADICRFFRNRIFELMHPTVQVAESAPTEQAEVLPMADEDYKGMKRREFYNAVNEQIRSTSADPEEEKMESGLPPAFMPPVLLVIAVILFFPLGIPALMFTRRAKKLWEQGEIRESYRTASASRMYCGIAISIGVIAFSILIRWLMR